MITREQLNQIEDSIRDLRMALDFKEQMDNDAPFIVLPLAEPISVTLDTVKKKEVDDKIIALEAKVKKDLAEIIK